MASSDSASTQNPFSSLSGTISPPFQRYPITAVGATAATLALTPANNGTTFIVPAMSNTCAVTLPVTALGAGLSWKFCMNGTVGNALTITSTTATIQGIYMLYTSGGLEKAAASTCVITATSILGDQLTITGDGTRWWVVGLGGAAASFS